MTFADLFRPVSAPADSADNRTPTLTMPAKVCFRKSSLPPGKNVGVALSALSAPPAGGVLVPLDVPFAEGCRYREAGAGEVATRLDCYRPDPTGPWIRRHGVLLRFHP